MRKTRERLHDMNDFIIFVQIDKIEWKQHTYGMNSSGWNNPKTFIQPKRQLSDQPFETRQCGVCGSNP